MDWTLTDLVTMFAPMAFLDSNEVNLPASTNDFLPFVGYQASNQYYAPGAWQWSLVLPSQQPQDHLVVPDTVSSSFKSGSLGDATTYVHVQAVAGQPNIVDFQYWLFYTFNGSETLRAEGTIGGTAEMTIPQSQHWGDWECVIVRVNLAQASTSYNGPAIVAVCFSQHSGAQWCLPIEMRFANASQPNVYVSRGSHANRPAPGGPFLIGGYDIKLTKFEAVDYADGKGPTVDYSKSFLIVANDATQYFPDSPPDPGWRTFQGFWGQPLSTTPDPGQIVDALWLLAKTTPVMAAFAAFLAMILGVPGQAAAFVLALKISVTQEAPKNPSVQGLWLNSLPLRELACRFTPSLAAFDNGQGGNLLSLVYVDSTSGNQLFASCSADGTDWSAPASVHSQLTKVGPSVELFNGVLWTAFVADNSSNQLAACTSTDGRTWSDSASTGQKSPAAPALAVFNNSLWLAFQANDSSNRLLVCSFSNNKWQTDHQISTQTTKTGPALAAFNRNLWVSFIANNPTNQLLICHWDGITWSDNSPVYVDNSPVVYRSTFTPALAVFHGLLWLAYTASNSSVMILNSPDGQTWTEIGTVGGLTTQGPPSLAVFDDSLYLACLSVNTFDVLLAFSEDGVSWSDEIAFEPT